MGGTIDDTELVYGLVLQKGSNKSAGGPTNMKHAKIDNNNPNSNVRNSNNNNNNNVS